MPSFEIATDHKFAIAAARVGWIDPSLPSEIPIGPFTILRSFPVEISEFWQDTLGTLRTQELESAGFYVVTQKPSASADILDAENKQLLDAVWRFYFGLLIVVPYISHGRGLKLTGANAGSGADIRQVQEFDPVHYTLGSPREKLTEEHLQEADNLGKAISKLASGGEHNRFWRVTHAFYTAVRAAEAGARIHQFIRCIEGCILPETGRTEKQFISRTELFVGPRHHELMRHLYEIRSAVEHLHGPLKTISAASERERRIILLRRSMEAEALARYCLRRLLTTPSLSVHFRSDSELEAFWKLDPADRSRIWGSTLDLPVVSAAFTDKYIDDEDLGLTGRD